MGTTTQDNRVTLGELIKRRREELSLTRPDLTKRLELRGFKLPSTTLRYWEKGGRASDTDWNPNFLTALAEALEMSEYELLVEMGFPVVPEGFTLEDMTLAKRIRELPPEKRKQAVRMLLAILDEL